MDYPSILPDYTCRHIPAWEDLPLPYQQELLILERLALVFDKTHKRCPRRECRRSEACRAAAGTAIETCEGAPGAHVEHWYSGMMLLYALFVDAVFAQLQPAPSGEEETQQARAPAAGSGMDATETLPGGSAAYDDPDPCRGLRDVLSQEETAAQIAAVKRQLGALEV